jgi:8-oxo-dGTP pyrophosphatase MutT (NUDIX family)
MATLRGADEFRDRPPVEFLNGPDLRSDRAHPAHAVASVLLATIDGFVLLALKSQGWGTVGGHIEADDASLRAAAARETLEELGLAIEPDELAPLSVVSDVEEFRPGCQHVDFCFFALVPHKLGVTAGSDISEARWFRLSDLPPVNDHMRSHLDALRARMETLSTRRRPSDL